MGSPKLLFGAGGIGEGRISHTWTTPPQVSELLESLKALGLTQLDGGASYPPGSPGVEETLLGQADASGQGFLIDSKVLVTGTPFGHGHLTAERIKESLDRTLELLGAEKVNVYYTHAPDPVTPLKETARGFDEQYRAGRFNQLGLCNVTAPLLSEYLAICEQHGYVKPTIIQCEYNAIRRTEKESISGLLQQHGIKFNAYSPLAGGFLTGKVTAPTDPDLLVSLPGTRWVEGRHPMFPKIFNRESVHVPMRVFMAACKEHGVEPAEVALRWLMHHSGLGEGDGLILGATRVEQLRGNVEACGKGPLGEELLKAVEALWEGVKGPMEEF